ncbi:MAG: histidine kinase [Oscillospiraceae bacterium]|nr:histidine kinase [Oscillospiraceae bacterium]
MRSERFLFRPVLLSLFTAVAVAAVWVYTSMSQNMLVNEMSGMLYKTNIMTQLYIEINSMQDILGEYISVSSTDSRNAYYKSQKQIEKYSHILSDINKSDSYEVKIENICAMADSYCERCDEIIDAKICMDTQSYLSGFNETQQQSSITVSYIKYVVAMMLENADKYKEITARKQAQNRLNYIILASSAAFVAVSVVISVKKYTLDLKNKSEIERQLHEQEIKTLKMENALHESDLLALQSQMNPHFIFNTINIGAKLAMLNSDNETCEYLENAADVFRYNLKGTNPDTTLREELENVKAYIYIMKIRFGDLFSFSLQADESALECRVPRMSLQPLIENAYIHGISSLESGGFIRLSVCRDDDVITVQVANNGKGMSSEIIRSIMCRSSDIKSTGKNHTTGLGLRNVIERMRLFYNTDDVISIDCSDGLTVISLKYRKENECVQDTGSR